MAITYAASPAKADEVVRAIESTGGKAIAIHADSGDADAVRGAVAGTVKALGRLDVLVNNAGVAAFGKIDEGSLEDFDRLMAVNVRGLFIATQEAVRHMKEGGRIINIGSVNSDMMPFPGGAVYAATKGAVSGLTRGWARDLGPRDGPALKNRRGSQGGGEGESKLSVLCDKSNFDKFDRAMTLMKRWETLLRVAFKISAARVATRWRR